MEQTKTGHIISAAIFYGALWGIIETSLGHALHYIPLQISGFIMFPIALLLMRIAFESVKDVRVIFYMGLIAAALKLIDLFIPGLPWIKTVNPSVAILMESTAVFLLAEHLAKGGPVSILKRSAVLNFSWRLGFILFALIINTAPSAQVKLVQSFSSIAFFLVINTSVSTLLSWGILSIKNIPDLGRLTRTRLAWVGAGSAAAAASVLQFIW